MSATLLLSACSTMKTAGHQAAGSRWLYAGTRLNLAAIRQDYDALDHFATYSIDPVPHPWLDLPLSVALDTALALGSCHLPGPSLTIKGFMLC